MSANELFIERILPAPPEVVFAAWSDAESLSTWMCPGGMEHADVEVDFRVGGRFRIEMQGQDQIYPQHGEYLVIEPPKRLVFTWVSEWMPAGERETEVAVTFEAEREGATRVCIHHYQLPDGGSYDGHENGWAEILLKLEERAR